MVDAIQELSQTSRREALPIAVVVSAWDEVEGLTPIEWLHARVPLLAQFLEANSERFPSAIFGVSVQGAEFFDPKDDEEAEGITVEIAADEPDPWDRAICVDADGSEAELVAPLVWAIHAGG